jgi:hypothetical protein
MLLIRLFQSSCHAEDAPAVAKAMAGRPCGTIASLLLPVYPPKLYAKEDGYPDPEHINVNSYE